MPDLARWQSTIVDSQGNIQAGALVAVRRDVPGQPIVPIFSDRAGTLEIDNPTEADGEGFVFFHVAGGAYKITATKNGFERVWRYVGIGRMSEADVGIVVGAAGTFLGEDVSLDGDFDLGYTIGAVACVDWIVDGIPQRPGTDFLIYGSKVKPTTTLEDDAIITWRLFGGAAEVTEFELKVDKISNGADFANPLAVPGNIGLGNVDNTSDLDKPISTDTQAALDDKQTEDATLAALAAHNTNGLLAQTAADTFTGRTLTGTADQITVTNGNGVPGNPTLSLPSLVIMPGDLRVPNTGLYLGAFSGAFYTQVRIGTTLTANRSLTISTGDSNRALDISASDVVISSFGASLVDDAAASNARTTLGLVIGTNVQAQNALLQDIADLVDPNADRILFWDDSAGEFVFLTAGSGLSIVGTTITAIGSAPSATASFSVNKNSSNQAGIVSATSTKITFGTEVFDIGSFYDTTNSRWTPPAGKVRLSATLFGSGTFTIGNLCYAAIYKNGSILKHGPYATSTATIVGTGVDLIDDANGTDYYEVYGYITTTAGTATVDGTIYLTYFQGHMI